jgi:hypothetical protein
MGTPATTPLTYNLYVTQMGTMAVVNTTTSSGVVVGVDAAFNAIIPQMLNYAELRIQRDLDILPLLTYNTYTLTPGTNILQISINDFVTVQDLSIINNGINYPLLATTKEYLQNVYGNSGATAQPTYFAMYGGDQATGGNTYNNILLGPYPDISYTVRINGTQRMPSLNQSATPSLAATGTTFISTYYPDLLIMASMIYISAYQRNFGRMSDDPAMAQSYESQYQVLVKQAEVEEDRKIFASSAWSPMSPTPVATPSR